MPGVQPLRRVIHLPDQSGKSGLIVLVLLLVLAVVFRNDIASLVSGAGGPEILSVESFECVFAMRGTDGLSGAAEGHAGRFEIQVKNLTEGELRDLFVEVTARHPDSRSNTRSASTPLGSVRIKPGKIGSFTGSVPAPQMTMASGLVEGTVCLMKLEQKVDGELEPINVRLNGLDLVPATAEQAPITYP